MNGMLKQQHLVDPRPHLCRNLMRFVMRRSDFNAAQSASGSPVLSSALSAELCRAGKQGVTAVHTWNPVMHHHT